MFIKLVRLLLVDDFQPFRRLISSSLKHTPALRVVGEAADGVEAVHRAEQLKPDVILLDIGLPLLSGLEAARRIRVLVPESKILFVSQECSADIVQETFNLGAAGYVVKTDVYCDLVIVIDAVIRGEKFVSASLTGPHHPNFTNTN